jgi:hypothetical protein
VKLVQIQFQPARFRTYHLRHVPLGENFLLHVRMSLHRALEDRYEPGLRARGIHRGYNIIVYSVL